MISEAMPTFLDKDLLMDVQYQKVTEKAKDYELHVSALTRVRNFFMIGQSKLELSDKPCPEINISHRN